MKRILLSLMRVFSMLILASGLFVGFLLFTHAGLLVSLGYLKNMLPGELEYRSISGTFTRLTLHDVNYYNGNMHLNIKELMLKLPASQLFKSHLSIESLQANNVDINLTESYLSSDGLNWYWLKSIDFKEINLSEIKILDHNVPTSYIKKFNIANGQFLVQLPKGDINGKYIVNDTRWHLTAKAKELETNFLFQGTDSTVSFDFLTEGDWQDSSQKAEFEINNLMGQVRGYPLVGLAKVSVQDNSIQIKNINLQSGKTVFKIQGEAGENLNLAWVVNIPSLANIYKNFSGSISSQGTVKVINQLYHVDGFINGKQLKFNNVLLNSVDGKFFTEHHKESTVKTVLICNKLQFKKYIIPLVTISVDSKLSKSAIINSIAANFSKLNRVYGTITIPNLLQSRRTAVLAGNLTLDFKDISKFIFSSSIKSQSGVLVGKVNITGTVFKPIYNGFIDVKNGRISLPQLAITPHAIQLHAVFKNNLFPSVNGSFISGSGTGLIKGAINFGQVNYPLQLSITGQNIQVANTTAYKITANPNLNLTMAGENASIQGSVLLPMIRIVTQNYFDDIVSLPAELEFVGQKKPVQYFKNLAIRMELEVGSQSYIAYKDLRATLAGKISVFQVPGGLPSANGALIIKQGTYRVHDRVFGIENGRLIYAGNLLNNPGLNIRAIQQASFSSKNILGFNMDSNSNSMKLGVSVTGTLHKPIINLISEPSLSQDDILSYMVFGQSRANISGLGALSLLGSVSSSANIQGPTTDDEQPDNADAESSKFGFSNFVQALNLSLPISKHWGIQTMTNLNETGVDVLYNYERK